MNIRKINRKLAVAGVAAALTSCGAYASESPPGVEHWKAASVLCVDAAPKMQRLLEYRILDNTPADYAADHLLGTDINDFQRYVLLSLSIEVAKQDMDAELALRWLEISLAFCIQNIGTESITNVDLIRMLNAV